jgi:hypothetical protein
LNLLHKIYCKSARQKDKRLGGCWKHFIVENCF